MVDRRTGAVRSESGGTAGERQTTRRIRIYTTKSGRKRYYIRFRKPDGKATERLARTMTGGEVTNLREAEAALAASNAALVAGDLAPWLRSKGPALTVAALVDRFKAEYGGPEGQGTSVAYRANNHALLGRVVSAIGDLSAETVSAADVERVRKEMFDRKPPYKAQTVFHTLARAQRMFAWAIEHKIVRRRDNPAAEVRKPKLPSKGKPVDNASYLTRVECRRLISWAKVNQPDEHPIYATAIFTGMRLGELRALRWADVRLPEGLIHVRGTKSPDAWRYVPIVKPLAIILRRWRREISDRATELVFGAPNVPIQRTIYNRLRRALDLCGLRRIPFHALRHSAASAFLASGVDLFTVAKILGHSDIRMTMRYSHLSPDHLADARAKFSLTPRRPRRG